MVRARKKGLSGLVPLLGGLCLLLAAGSLPPDTALSKVKAAGRLRVCHPSDNPPWITRATAGQPAGGIDLVLLGAISRNAGWDMVSVPVAQMDAGINPRRWGLTRARCDVIAGGLVLTEQTRGFLDAPVAHATFGWSLVTLEAKGEAALTPGATIGVYVASLASDRAKLGGWIRAQGLAPTIFARPEALIAALRAGTIVAAVTDAPLREGSVRLRIGRLPPPFARQQVGFGFWKGDATLRDAVLSGLSGLEAQGQLAGIQEFYQVSAGDGGAEPSKDQSN
ncbi:Bacterial extracellular solute-binding proteins, family 3 [Aquimixticola soesokkakensis]|uniref:Bacterial extracellular solute-binding proteins, family 3 n=1 Tax=Aquimixticola soesokkakensis TaxID=1519096 RepID=A0A1Y5TH03_9RHOB|nr:transporter substrate-binding domain-containing protein [Aquimixticola soesokkakensis]SLN63821.1 Bacterial extracellular solute-binding proteins, family 3 [Aquimixticola soesokkakensis]